MAFSPNALDTNTQRRFAFPGQTLDTKMISRNIDIPFFRTSDSKEKFKVMACYARGRCVMEGWSIQTTLRPLAALEAVAPNLPEASFLNAQESRTMFVAGCLSSLQGRFSNNLLKPHELNFSNSTYRDAEIQAIIRRFPSSEGEGIQDGWNTKVMFHTLMNTQAANREAEVMDFNISVNQAEAIARIFAELVKYGTPTMNSMNTAIYTLAYIGMAKRGIISEEKMAKMNEAIRAE